MHPVPFGAIFGLRQGKVFRFVFGLIKIWSRFRILTIIGDVIGWGETGSG